MSENCEGKILLGKIDQKLILNKLHQQVFQYRSPNTVCQLFYADL